MFKGMFNHRWTPNQFLWVDLWLSTSKIEHTRKVYNFIDLISDLGGVLNIINTVIMVGLASISEHSFILRAL